MIVTIDPGLGSCGVALWSEDWQLESVHALMAPLDDVRDMHIWVGSLIRAQALRRKLQSILEGRPVSRWCSEALSPPRNASNSIKIGIAFGTLQALAGDLAIEQYKPMLVKEVVTGNSTAEKDEMIAAIEKRYPGRMDHIIRSNREHAADAIGVGDAARLCVGEACRMGNTPDCPVHTASPTPRKRSRKRPRLRGKQS